MIRKIFLLLPLVFTVTGPCLAGSKFIAFSLRAAERQMAYPGGRGRELVELGGMNLLVGLVRDAKSDDWIIVGRTAAGRPPISLDDFVVALRALFKHHKLPLVSLDPGPDTHRSNQLVARYEGGIENTPMGREMIDADILLKQIALERVKTEIWGVRSYVSLRAEDAEKGGGEDKVVSRFWFKNLKPSYAYREDVCAIMEIAVGIETEVLSAEKDGRPVEDLKKYRDRIGDLFAGQMTSSLSDLSENYPVLKRALPIMAMVSLVEGMGKIQDQPNLGFWLEEYPMPDAPTPTSYDLVTVNREIAGKDLRLSAAGGLQVNPISVWLKKGRTSVLRDVVLSSRPSKDALTWHPPLQGWRTPGADDVEEEDSPGASGSDQAGFSLEASVTRGGPSVSSPSKLFSAANFRPPDAGIPRFAVHEDLPIPTTTRNVGGVMLSGAAKVDGGRRTRVDLAEGNFSLIVGGENARLEPEMFRKFITALWAVYYGEADPGISIDPIAPGVEKHLVRYIGKVINTDLGRVMREADYSMKKWAVGTERPDIPGFQDVDDLSARHGLNLVGASRRFWFVPQEMKFKAGEGMLLFEAGRMTLKTEYVFQDKGVKAEPADEAFARFFTDRYLEIAEKHPVYRELFEYAKLVSLARFLKEKGVPLFWFLMANKDLVLTEDSPGTVDALVKGSEHFKDLRIEGGVDLGSEGSYVYDPDAIRTIREAVAGLPPTSVRISDIAPGEVSMSPARRFTFELDRKGYTVLPQHALTSGRDRRGIRYQTDLALRNEGRPGLELVRWFDPRHQESSEFGQGWHLLLPYRIERRGGTRPFLNASIPESMTVKNLITGVEDALAFSEDRYSIAGYVPDRLEASQIVGLFILSDASFRLVDKIGNEFWFDPAGHLTDMRLSDTNRTHFDYLESLTDAIEQTPYRLKPSDEEKIDFLNVVIPKRMKVHDLIHGDGEVLAFSDQGPIAGYVPADPEKCRFRILAIMSDASYRLLDKEGVEIEFDPAGALKSIHPPLDRRMVKSVSSGQEKVDFKYSIDPSGRFVIGSAILSGEAGKGTGLVIRYEYDLDGRLCSARSTENFLSSADGSEGKDRKRS